MKSRNFEKSGREIVVLAHNIRSVLNVGSILRSCEGFGISRVFATGWTPNLSFATDGSGAKLLPHVREKLRRELHKTALGAEEIVDFAARADVFDLISELRENGFLIVGLEQDSRSVELAEFSRKNPAAKMRRDERKENSFSFPNEEAFSRAKREQIALLLGEEVDGLSPELRENCDVLVEIPMFGRKESFNVSVAAGICLYELSRK